MKETKATKTWLVVAGRPTKYIVCSSHTKDEVLAALTAGGVIRCINVFDYTSPIAPTQLGGISKHQVVSTLDATLAPTVAYISLQGALLYFLDDLSDADGQEYKKLLKDATQLAQQAAHDRRRGQLEVAR